MEFLNPGFALVHACQVTKVIQVQWFHSGGEESRESRVQWTLCDAGRVLLLDQDAGYAGVVSGILGCFLL